ncbi:hypothetical protein [Antrihabitans cavernicola]|uniref:Uncharacterized protein n=1 Tax=Antrihabitans cavernicola TaxID=2495913 RepID=A0A5A7SBF2_9NOCA|nr:hypothetical protein [Spelaeibacter cavernicola]KAA0022482.1 hypothetical protein FOY51_12285 [Spelaeibacter cavernicola]
MARAMPRRFDNFLGVGVIALIVVGIVLGSRGDASYDAAADRMNGLPCHSVVQQPTSQFVYNWLQVVVAALAVVVALLYLIRSMRTPQVGAGISRALGVVLLVAALAYFGFTALVLYDTYFDTQPLRKQCY